MGNIQGEIDKDKENMEKPGLSNHANLSYDSIFHTQLFLT